MGVSGPFDLVAFAKRTMNVSASGILVFISTDAELATLKHRSWDVFLAEAQKCDALCANCHRELHDNG